MTTMNQTITETSTETSTETYKKACAALQTEFRAKMDALAVDYMALRTPLETGYWPTCNMQAADYDARKKEYYTSYNRIGTEYRKNHTAIYADNRTRRNALDAEYYANEWAA